MTTKTGILTPRDLDLLARLRETGPVTANDAIEKGVGLALGLDARGLAYHLKKLAGQGHLKMTNQKRTVGCFGDLDTRVATVKLYSIPEEASA